ncbi:PR domain zinc finger protein 1 [Biomphalaria glabrata]|nr:PR domain zinc finger protein 1 [Biomphalaria glabrata]
MGVVTVSDIDYGQIFGPFPTHVTATDPAYVIGMLTCDRQPDGVLLRVDTEERRGGIRNIDWLPYVSPARDEEEQNMEAYPKEGGVYYRTLRIVKAGEELLVWYSKDFTQLLGVPELQSNSKRDDEQYICSHCGEMFDFPYPLRAHLKFKCTFTAEDRLFPPVPAHPLTKLNGNLRCLGSNAGNDIEGYAENKQHQMLSYMTNNNAMFTIASKRHLEDSGAEAPPAKKASDVQLLKTKKDSIISHSIEELSKSHVSKAREDLDIGRGDAVPEGQSAFRKVTSEHTLSPIPIITNFPLRTKTISPPMKTSSPPSATSSLNSPVMGTTHGLPTTKTNSPVSAILHSPTAVSPRSEPCSSSMPPPVRPPVKPMASQMTPVSSPDQSRPPIMGLYMPRIPLIPTPSALGIPGGSLLGASSSSRALSMHHSAFPDQIPPGLLEMCRATIPAVGPLTESFAANIRNCEHLAKQALFADRHISSLGFLKSTNPMVEKLLQSTNPTLLSSPINALNLSQNWCAKCNATFRMTSDLVYHMRSHHKREFDPMKRRREEKLKCNICNEAFRERHHLTRHMSSHA